MHFINLQQEWKKYDIMPIYKRNEEEGPLNYRPVSLTSIVCKICEKLEKQWTAYLEREGILRDKQLGFRNGRSRVTNVLSLYSRMVDITQERNG